MSNSSTIGAYGLNSSSNNLDIGSPNATAFAASLTRAFSNCYKFTILERNLDRQNSPELMQVKELVKKIPRIEFQAVLEIGKHLQQSYSRIADYRRQLLHNYEFVKNAPEHQRAEELKKIANWAIEETNNLGAGGEQCIASYGSHLTECSSRTEEEAEKIQLKINAIHMLRDETEYWQGFWDAVEDKLLPDAEVAAGTPAKPIVALALWVGSFIASGTIYYRSWGREKLLEVLQTWEDDLTTEYNMILKTEEELGNYADEGAATTGGLWIAEVENIRIKLDTNRNNDHKTTIVRYNAYITYFQVTERMIMGSIEPFSQALNRMYPLHGSGISVHRNANDFCKDIPHALDYLKKLLTAKAVIHSNKQEEFQKKVHCLARIIYGHLKHIQQLCAPWSKSLDPEELATFIEQTTLDFVLQTERVILAIKQMLETEARDSEAAQALQDRTKGDRHLKSKLRKDRPLVSSKGAFEVLKDLEATIRVIYRLSVCTGTGTNMSAMEGMIEAQRSHPEFNHSNSLLQDFFRVLREEIQRGLLAFPEREEIQRGSLALREREESSEPSRRGWRRWFRGQKQKPEAFISGL